MEVTQFWLLMLSGGYLLVAGKVEASSIFVNKLKGRLQKKRVKLGLLAEPHLTPPPPLNLGPVIRWKKVMF